jgi:hypothetical protein
MLGYALRANPTYVLGARQGSRRPARCRDLFNLVILERRPLFGRSRSGIQEKESAKPPYW